MADRYFLLIDNTQESHAPFFANNHIFRTWLHSYDNVPDALQFLSSINLPYSVEAYLPRDCIFDIAQPLADGASAPTLIQTLCDLQTVSHVTVYSANIDNDLRPQLLSILPDKRLLKDVISVVDLRGYLCRHGITYFQQKSTDCLRTQEVHLTTIFQQNIDDLQEYFNRINAERRQMLETLRDQHGDRPGVQES